MVRELIPDWFAEGGPLSLEEQPIFAGSLAVRQRMALRGQLSPSQITGNQNDYNPARLGESTVLRLTSDASRNVTGIYPGINPRGRVLLVFNVGSNNIVLKDSDTGSVAGNRFDLNGDVTLAASEGIWLWYDVTSSRWRPGEQKTHDQSHPTSDHTWELDKVKLGGESVNDSDALQDDNDLAFAVGALEVWAFEMLLVITTSSTADFKFAFTVPTGATIRVHGDFLSSAAGGTGATADHFLGGGTATYSFEADAFNTLRLSGYVEVGVNAGTVQLQWAQGTATAVNTTVASGSWLKPKRLA